MSKDSRIVQVSFRDTTRDIILYVEVLKKEKYEKSEFVKNALEFYIKYLEGGCNAKSE